MPHSIQRHLTDDLLSDEMTAVLRTKTPADRLAIAFGMWRFARQLIERTARAVSEKEQICRRPSIPGKPRRTPAR